MATRSTRPTSRRSDSHRAFRAWHRIRLRRRHRRHEVEEGPAFGRRPWGHEPRPDGVARPHGCRAKRGPSSPSLTPLELVSAAVAGEDLEVLASTAAEALGRPVAIVVPTLGDPIGNGELVRYAQALISSAHEGGGEGSRRALLQALRAGPPANVDAFVMHAQRLGFDLSAGAVAVCARGAAVELPGALAADLGCGRVYGLMPLAATDGQPGCEGGVDVAVSAPRHHPAGLHDALREAELLLELGSEGHDQEQTYRLLVGVLFRDPEELERLRAETIAPLTAYDADHDTELLATLQQFLLHHGSTTETAEAMRLHRHTVGYRLARVHEVSALSPYESEGRERLSLGLKAHHILTAHEHLSKSNLDRLAPARHAKEDAR